MIRGLEFKSGVTRLLELGGGQVAETLTDGYRNILTESVQWADSLKI